MDKNCVICLENTKHKLPCNVCINKYICKPCLKKYVSYTNTRLCFVCRSGFIEFTVKQPIQINCNYNICIYILNFFIFILNFFIFIFFSTLCGLLLWLFFSPKTISTAFRPINLFICSILGFFILFLCCLCSDFHDTYIFRNFSLIEYIEHDQ